MGRLNPREERKNLARQRAKDIEESEKEAGYYEALASEGISVHVENKDDIKPRQNIVLEQNGNTVKISHELLKHITEKEVEEK